MDELNEKVHQFLGDGPLFDHCLAVAKTAKMLAEKYGENPSKAYIAGLLHDVGGYYPNDKRVAIANEAGIPLLEEEEAYPLLIHQKISKFLARWKFGIFNDEILSAIECHTTLKANFTRLDLIVFLADKISPDHPTEPQYKAALLKALERSPETAALFYINEMLKRGVPVTHPWLLEAKKELEEKIN